MFLTTLGETIAAGGYYADRFNFGRISEFCSSREVEMKLKHLAYHGGRKGTGSLGDNRKMYDWPLPRLCA